jgi:GDP-4-dehydro-6-deoxy-D-mannose reductase
MHNVWVKNRSGLMKALITGINGFVGRHLAELLQKENVDLIGIDRQEGHNTLGTQYIMDINDRDSMEKVIGDTRPDYIFHLAAPAFIPDSYDNPQKTFESIIFGTVSLLEAIRNSSPYSKLLFVGSSDEYGTYGGIPFHEEMLPKPCTPYASSKASASMICEQYAAFYNINAVRTRSFNHMGPGQSPRFVSSSMARQISILERSGGNELLLGNLSTSRDFLDVRDVVRAYYKIMCLDGNAGQLYNVCSGTQTTINFLLDEFLSHTELKERPRFTVRSESQNRKNDNLELCGDNSKLREATGWFPQIPFETTVLDILIYWRSQI